MYNRKNQSENKLLDAFIWGVEDFISVASKLEVFKREGTFRCPCLKCKCLRFHMPDEVRLHLYRKGFQPHYYYWHNHGEIEPPILRRSYEVDPISNDLNQYERMVNDAGASSFYSDPEFKEKLEQNKKNKSVREGGCLYQGGSISMSEHKKRYTRELGREATIPELFYKLNYNNETNQWSTPRAEKIYSSFEKLKEDVVASGSSVDDSALFFQAIGGKNKRGRAYGFGSEAAFYSSSGSKSNRFGSQSAATAPNTDELTQLQQRIAVLETQLKEERTRGDRFAQLEAELNTLRASVDCVAQFDIRFSQLESELATLKGYFQQCTSHTHSGHNNSEAAPTTSL